MSRPTLIAGLVVLVVLGGGIFAWDAYTTAEEEKAAARRESRREAREREREQELQELADRLQESSEGQFPPPLDQLALGITEAELRTLRPNIQPKDEERPGTWYEEQLGNGAQAIYAIGDESGRLGQVQVLSMVPPEGIPPHLTALVERYGSPTGAWHCPSQSAAGVPTRRFTWRMDRIAIQDIILVHPGGVSITLYIAPADVIGQSLQLSRCRPVSSREEMADLPVATQEQMAPNQP